nr:hypothetical protein [Tanacetum cinerariifolium]
SPITATSHHPPFTSHVTATNHHSLVTNHNHQSPSTSRRSGHQQRETKDGMNARLDLAELGIKPELFARQEEDKTTLPLAGYALTNAKNSSFVKPYPTSGYHKGGKIMWSRMLSVDVSLRKMYEDDQDKNDDGKTASNNDSDDFVHLNFSTHDEESFDPIVRTPSHDDKTNDEDNDEDSDGMNVEGGEGENEEDDADEIYRNVNINLEGRDIQMADVQTTQVIEDTHVTLTLINPDGQQQSLCVDVSVSTDVEPPLLSVSTLPSPTISIIPRVQQTLAPSPVNVPSSSLQDLPNFGLLLGFDHRIKTLETNFSKFMQTNQFVEAVSSILGVVDNYIDHRINEAVKVAVRLQSDRLQDEVTLKRRRDDKDKDEEPSAGSNWGSKRRRDGKESESTSALTKKTSKTSGKSIKGSKS